MNNIKSISRGLQYEKKSSKSPRFYILTFEDDSVVKIFEDDNKNIFNEIDLIYMK